MANTEIATAYVQIIPSARGIKGSLSRTLGGEASSAGSSAGESIGSSLVGKLKGIIVAAGIGEVVKNAISAGADVEQSFGGLETIYGDASKAAKDYAAEAYKAGISMNDYAEQAVSFGAGLKQAFDGDTAKAVEAANTAIMDMTDNAAKMGTPIESIQNAYQGFAKSNYTMLDNLKLGYGGTKTEMERLLKDAEKISGVKYDIGNLGDVYDAIHVIQGELGLTGVAAEEASTTLSGSLGAMKASFTNLLATITTGGDVRNAFNNLTATMFAFVQNNLIPMIGNILKALPDIVVGVLSSGIALINNVFSDADMVSTGMDLIISLGEGIIEQIPYLLETLWNIATRLGEQIINYDWSGTFNTVVEDIADIINVASSEILGVEGSDMLGYLAQSIMDAIPTILTTATEIINGLVTGILNALPGLLEVGTQVLSSILDGIMTQFPNIMQAAADIVMNLFNGIINNLPQIVVGAVKLITTLLTTFIKHYPEILKKGIEIIGQLVAGLIRAIPKVIPAVIQIISGIKDTIKQVDWLQLGIDIVKGIVEGLKSAGGLIKDAVTAMAKEAWGGMKDFFKSEGGSGGDEESSSSSGSQGGSSSKNSSSPSSSVQSTISANTVNTNSSSANDNIVTTQKMYDLMSEYLPQMTQSHTQVNVSLEGDAKGLFNAVRTENTKLIRATGYHALA